MARKSICILSFSNVQHDARVLRQIKYLAYHYELTVIGLGESDSNWSKWGNIEWISINQYLHNKPASPIFEQIWLTLSRLHKPFYENVYWQQPIYSEIKKIVAKGSYNAIHANDWNTLPIAVHAAASRMCVVFDSHEWEEQWYRQSLIKKYAHKVSATVTVSPPIAQKYKTAYGVEPTVIMNVPELVSISSYQEDSTCVRLIHHGAPSRGRRLELMIQTVALCQSRFHLEFMLTNSHPDYVEELKELTAEVAPGRVTFRDAVPPDRIVSEISQYDLGLCLIYPSNYSFLMSLPNKFFEFIMAGLAVCIGPSPAMVEFTQKYKVGCIAPDFQPETVATVLNNLSYEQIQAMRASACEARKTLNAQVEMSKLVKLYEQLFCTKCSSRN